MVSIKSSYLPVFAMRPLGFDIKCIIVFAAKCIEPVKVLEMPIEISSAEMGWPHFFPQTAWIEMLLSARHDKKRESFELRA